MTTSTLSTLTSLRILLPLILLLSAMAIYLNRQKQAATEPPKPIAVLVTVLLLIYLIIYFYLTFGFRSPSKEPILMLRPFWSYQAAFQFSPLKVRRLGLARQILLNILLTIPAGLLLPILYRTKHPYLHTALTILLLSLLTEVFQYLTRLGFTETDDLINNLLGGLLGMGILRIGSIHRKQEPDRGTVPPVN